MSDILGWILVIVSALLLVGVIGGLIAFVSQLFRETRRPKRRAKSGKKKNT